MSLNKKLKTSIITEEMFDETKNELYSKNQQTISQSLKTNNINIKQILSELTPILDSNDSKIVSKSLSFLSSLVEDTFTKNNPKDICCVLSFLSIRINQINTNSEIIELFHTIYQNHFSVTETSEPALKMLKTANTAIILSKSRNKLYKVAKLYFSTLKKIDKNFVTAFISLIDGENDPNCLLTIFGSFETLLKLERIDGDLADEFFESLSRYFPLSYGSEEEDDSTKEHLTSSLRNCLCSGIFLDKTMPLLIEKYDFMATDETLQCTLIFNEIIAKTLFVKTEPYLDRIFLLLKEKFLRGQNGSFQLKTAIFEGFKIIGRKRFSKASVLRFKGKRAKNEVEKTFEEQKKLFASLLYHSNDEKQQQFAQISQIVFQVASASPKAFAFSFEKAWLAAEEAFYAKDVNFSLLSAAMDAVMQMLGLILRSEKPSIALIVRWADVCDLFRSGLIGASPDVRSLSVASLETLTALKFGGKISSDLVNECTLVERFIDLLLTDSAMNVRLQALKSLETMLSLAYQPSLDPVLQTLFDQLFDSLSSSINKETACDVSRDNKGITKEEIQRITQKAILVLGANKNCFSAFLSKAIAAIRSLYISGKNLSLESSSEFQETVARLLRDVLEQNSFSVRLMSVDDVALFFEVAFELLTLIDLDWVIAHWVFCENLAAILAILATFSANRKMGHSGDFWGKRGGCELFVESFYTAETPTQMLFAAIRPILGGELLFSRKHKIHKICWLLFFSQTIASVTKQIWAEKCLVSPKHLPLLEDFLSEAFNLFGKMGFYGEFLGLVNNASGLNTLKIEYNFEWSKIEPVLSEVVFGAILPIAMARNSVFESISERYVISPLLEYSNLKHTEQFKEGHYFPFCLNVLKASIITNKTSLTNSILFNLIHFLRKNPSGLKFEQAEDLGGIVSQIKSYINKDIEADFAALFSGQIVLLSREKDSTMQKIALICLSGLILSLINSEWGNKLIKDKQLFDLFLKVYKLIQKEETQLLDINFPMSVNAAFFKMVRSGSVDFLDEDAVLDVICRMTKSGKTEERLNCVKCLVQLFGMKTFHQVGVVLKVIGALDTLIDDPKRIVRRNAVFCKNKWIKFVE